MTVGPDVQTAGRGSSDGGPIVSGPGARGPDDPGPGGRGAWASHVGQPLCQMAVRASAGQATVGQVTVGRTHV